MILILLNVVNEVVDEITEVDLNTGKSKFDEIYEAETIGASKPISGYKTESTNRANEIVVATSPDFEPFEYYQGDKFIGIDMEIAKMIADRAGKTLVIIAMEFDSIIENLNAGKADIGMSGFTITESRSKVVNFSHAYYHTTQYIAVRENDNTFKELTTKSQIENAISSIKNVKGGCGAGMTGYFYLKGNSDMYFDGYSNVNIKEYDSLGQAVEDLKNGKIKFVIGDKDTVIDAVEACQIGNAWSRFNDQVFKHNGYKQILKGLRNTLIIAVCGLLIGLVLGSLVAGIKVAGTRNKVAKYMSYIGDGYVALFRGTPIVVQLLIFYFVIFKTLNIDGLFVGIICFGLNSGAYVSEIMRGGINSVDMGQMEAGRCVGLSFTKTMFKVVLPQAIKNVLPSLGNELIALVKDTSVVGFIATIDLTRSFRSIASANYEYMAPYIVLAIFYLVIILIITILVRLMEKRLKKDGR